MKEIIKKNRKLYQVLVKTREIIRVIYNTKTRSRYLWMLKKGDDKFHLTINLVRIQ